MRPSRSSALLVAFTAALSVPRLRAQTTGTPEGAAFLLVPVGARATALGQAAVADIGSTESIFWNPAGLAELKHTQLALHHYADFFGTGDAFVIAMPLAGLGTFTAAAYIVDYGEVPITLPGGGGTSGSAIARNVALEASYATQLVGGLSAGIAYKLVQLRFDCTGECPAGSTMVGTTHAVDVGLRYVLPGAMPIVVGAAIRNVGFPLQVNNQAQADPMPTRLQIGVAWVLVRPVPDADAFDVRVLADLQGAVGQGGSSAATLVGLESGLREVLRVRAGFAFVDSRQRGPSLGVGVKVGRLGIDLAMTFFPSDAIAEKDPLHVSLRLDF
jgi:hypothetical protein